MPVFNTAVIYVALGLSYVRHFRLSSRWILVCLVDGFLSVLSMDFCLSSHGHFVCLVSSFRYNGLATLALAGPSGPRAGPSGPLRALRARRAGPSGPLQEIPSHRQEVVYMARPIYVCLCDLRCAAL